MRTIQWLVIPLTVMLVSCMQAGGETTRPVAFDPVPNPEQWVLGDEPAYRVVTEKNWSLYYSNPPKGADFDTYIYLVASLGIKPNPGYGVTILQLEQMEDRMTAKVRLMEPDPKKVYPQVIVRPIAVVAVAKSELGPHGLLTFVFVDQKGRLLAAIKTET